MMAFEPYLSGTLFFAVIAVLFVLWIYQLVVIWKSTFKRKWVKSLLQSTLFCTVVLFLLQPTWENRQPGISYLVDPEGFDRQESKRVQDSLSIDLAGTVGELPKKQLSEIFILGQDYKKSALLQLPKTSLTWIPYFSENQLTAISWDGIISHGQHQHIRGSVFLSQSAKAQLYRLGELIQEVEVGKEKAYFEFQFPALILGQNELELKINGEESAAIRFFVNPSEPVTYRLLFGYPNPEGRILTEYLIRRGDKASISSQISKVGKITSGAFQSEQSPDVFILDPSQLKNREIMDAVAGGTASLLVLNLDYVQRDIASINTQFKTDLKLKKVGDEPRETENGAFAVPYVFEAERNIALLDSASVSLTFVQGNKIAVSLLGATYPFALEGDSVRYAQIWENILAAVNPPAEDKIEVQAPVFAGLFSDVHVRSQKQAIAYLQVDDDSITLQRNPVNLFKAKGSLVLKSAGWKNLGDSLQLYAYGEGDIEGLRDIAQLKAILRDRSDDDGAEERIDRRRLSEVAWLLLLLAAFTLVWIEPRIPYY